MCGVCERAKIRTLYTRMLEQTNPFHVGQSERYSMFVVAVVGCVRFLIS